jgi:Cu/Zn superoxide dismutase
MKLVLSTAALGAALVLAATAQTSAPMGGSHMMVPKTMAPASLTVTMKALNGSAETGTATLKDTPKGLVVTLHLKNGKGPQPAHIHKGSCAKLDPKPEEGLHNVVNGMSVTTVPGVTIAALLKTPHAINVHKSLTDLPTYVSCGDIAK